MYQVYLRQTLQMLKQNKFFSIVYIAGTGLAIAMVMVLTILYYLRTGPIAPESYRDRMMVVYHGKVLHKENKSNGNARFSYSTIRQCFYPMQTPEAVTAILPVGKQFEFIRVPGQKEGYNGLVMGTDAAFWKVFRFTFVSGKPYTEEEFASGLRKAVVNESLARRLFHTSDAAGKTFSLNFEEFIVAGVVKDAPSVATYSYAEMWIPFTVRPDLISGGAWCNHILGPMYVCILAKQPADFEAIRREAEALCRRYNATIDPYTLYLNGQPDSVFHAFLHTDTWKEPDYTAIYLQIACLLFLLLLVPSINLTGMTASRMKKRMEELGVRKAFGARNRTLLLQILYENLLLTFLGGVVGLGVSYGLIGLLKEWLLGQYSWDGTPLAASIDLSPGMLLNPAVFGYAFLFCLVLNLLSTVVPAWHALQRPVVGALNNK